MKDYAMIIDYGYCTGCKSCEVSCRNEKDIPVEEWGMRINELGPKTLKGVWEWDYLPSPSRLCDLCVDRVRDGQRPSCELHCLADVIRVVPLETVSERLAQFDKGKLVVYVP